MKRALRIILPIILVLIILVSAVWYLMVYDPDFTKDTILSTARSFDKGGHHKIAAWLYDLAYDQSKGGDEVAIELANHYKSNGNYTKAEYTLSNAIADGGTVELYIALCQTYVEQDKLLDAVNMLDSIKDPAIQEAISAMRPTVPTLTPTPGFYSQYVTVSAEGDGSSIYLNLKGEYPSTSDLYKEPLPLPEGETTIYGIAINDKNIVSPLAIHGYTIGGIIKEVTFTDKTMEAYVRQQLLYNESRAIYSNDLWDILEITIPEGVESLEDLQHFTYLETLTISNMGDLDLSPVSSLTALKTLIVSNCDVSQASLKAIGNLRGLRSLTMASCNLSTIAPLEGLVELTHIDLSDNTLRNISIFSGFTKLQELRMAHNVITDLDALTGLKQLTYLDITNNSVQSLKPIHTLTGLQTLMANNNAISAVDGISAMSSLNVLQLSQNGLLDMSPIAGCTTLTELDISKNDLKTIAAVKDMTALFRLNASNNRLTELPVFTSNHKLGYIDVSYNQIRDIQALSALTELFSVNLDYNSEITTLNPLKSCRHLLQVDAFGTKITEIPFEKDSGVVVNCDFSKTLEDIEDRREQNKNNNQQQEEESTEQPENTEQEGSNG